MSADDVVPVAWMYPSKLELFKTCETRAHAWSIQVGNQDGELSVPLYSQATVTALQAHIAELEEWVARWQQLAETNARIIDTGKRLDEIDAEIKALPLYEVIELEPMPAFPSVRP